MNVKKPSLHDDWIDIHAKRIIQILQNEGFQGYLVGGCVRDLLVGIHPKDFDIATNALPQQVKRKVPHSYIIGRRFKLVLTKRGDQQFEIATFRRTPEQEDIENKEDNIIGDNYFGTSEEDAKRRDFTINALFYDPIKSELIDYVDGMKDIQSRTLRMIGNPKERFIEDPIRILRAIRLTHKINFSIEEEMRKDIFENAQELLKSVLPRRREEWLKIMRLPDPILAWTELYDLNVLKYAMPSLHQIFENPDRREAFEFYLNESKKYEFDLSNPLEAFSVFIYSFLKSVLDDDQFKPDIIESHEGVQILMRDELGMFKQEMSNFVRAIDFINSLQKTDSFIRRGERRQLAFLQNEIFRLSLKLSQLDHQVNTHDFYFWIRNYHRHLFEIER